MPDFKVPLKDYSFLFNDVLDMQSKYQHVKGGDQATPDMLDAIFSEAAKFSETELAPLYQSGDKGCTWDDGVVTTPASGCCHHAIIPGTTFVTRLVQRRQLSLTELGRFTKNGI